MIKNGNAFTPSSPQMCNISVWGDSRNVERPSGG